MTTIPGLEPSPWRAVGVRWVLLTACGYLLGVAAAWPVELAARAVWPWPFPYFNVLQHGPTAMGALVK